MGVYIEKMKRPEGCYCCPFAEGSWGYSPPNRKWCLVNGKDMPIDERNVQQNQHQCSLIELPPHGRLIDAAALMRKKIRSVQSGSGENFTSWTISAVSIENIRNAPTIIPADVPDNNVGNIPAEDGE